MTRGTGTAARAAVNSSAVNAFPATPKTSIPLARNRSTARIAFASCSNMAQRGQDSSDNGADGDDEASLQLPTPDSSDHQVSSPASVQSSDQSSECGEEPENSDSEQEVAEDDDSDTAVEVEDSDNDAESETSDQDVESHIAADAQSEFSESSDEDPDEDAYHHDRYDLLPSDRNDIHQSEDEEADDSDSDSDKQVDVSEDDKLSEDESENEIRVQPKEYVPGNDTLALEEQGHWDWNNPGYDYEEDPLVCGDVRPFPREKIVLEMIMSHFMPEDHRIVMKACFRDGEPSAGLKAIYSEEDYQKINDIISVASASRASYKCLGAQAFRMLCFDFVKTAALKGLLTGSRKWEASDGLPPILGGITTITIHESFKEKFGDWCANMALLEALDDEGKCKELNGLKEVIFTGMPAGRSVAEIGTFYMPSSLEKLRALIPKLKKRGMQTWVVEEGGVDKEEVTVRLIYGHKMHDEEFGIQDDEVLLDPAYEMKSYRKVLAVNKQNKASRRLSAGLASQSPEKGKTSKRRIPSDTSSRQTKKSPKKTLGSVRHRRRSDESEANDSSAGDDEKLDRRMSDLTFDDSSDSEDEVEAPPPIITEKAMRGYRKRLRQVSTQAKKDAVRASIHKLLDVQMDLD